MRFPLVFWLPHPVFCVIQPGAALSHCCVEQMSPILNAVQGSCSLSMEFKEGGSVVTWGDPEGTDGFTVIAFHGWSRKMAPSSRGAKIK